MYCHGGGFVLGDLDTHRLRITSAAQANEERRSSLEDANLAEAISRMQDSLARARNDEIDPFNPYEGLTSF